MDRLARRTLVALVAALALSAIPACSSNEGGGPAQKQMQNGSQGEQNVPGGGYETTTTTSY